MDLRLSKFHPYRVYLMDVATEISLQEAKVEDAKILTHTCKRAFDSDSEFGAPGPGGPPGVDSEEWNVGAIKNQYLQYYSILKGTDIVGGYIVGNRGPGYQVCERIWIDPDHMKQGIGKKTFELIWEKYPLAESWVLGTPEWNTRTNPFYKSIGFVQIGKTFDHLGWDGIYYEKRISDGLPKAMSKIGNLHEGQQRVIVEGYLEKISETRVVSSRKTGEELSVADAVLKDDTGTIKLVLWNDHIRQVKVNSNIRFDEGYVKAYRDELQLGIGQWGALITLL